MSVPCGVYSNGNMSVMGIVWTYETIKGYSFWTVQSLFHILAIVSYFLAIHSFDEIYQERKEGAQQTTLTDCRGCNQSDYSDLHSDPSLPSDPSSTPNDVVNYYDVEESISSSMNEEQEQAEYGFLFDHVGKFLTSEELVISPDHIFPQAVDPGWIVTVLLVMGFVAQNWVVYGISLK